MSKLFTIFDLDGCLSDHDRRWDAIDHNIADLDERYSDYNEKCDEDQPMNMNIVKLAARSTCILIVTARPECVREKTERWCQQHVPGFNPDLLLMRPTGNHQHSPELKIGLLSCWLIRRCAAANIVCAFDDRVDVLHAYTQHFGIAAQLLTKPCPEKVMHDERFVRVAVTVTEDEAASTPAILREMATTFQERNAIYGSNYKMIGPMMALLFPEGVSKEVLTADQFHLFELILVKLSRFSISNLTHTDSIHDAAVYCAMIESIIRSKTR